MVDFFFPYSYVFICLLYNVEYENLTVQLGGFVCFYENMTQLKIRSFLPFWRSVCLECPEVLVALAPQVNEHQWWCLNNIQLTVLTCL